DPAGSDGRQPESAGSHEAIPHAQLVPALEANLSLLIHEDAVAGCDAHRSPVGRRHLEERFVERMAEHRFDRAEPHLLVLPAEAQNVAEWLTLQTVIPAPRRRSP